MVTSDADNGAGSLRAAVANAPANSTINFAANLQGATGNTINLQTQITIGANQTGITIDGTGSTVTISGQNKTRIFEIAGTATNATINNLTFTGGNGGGGNGGAILVDASSDLNINSDTFTQNKVTAANANGGAIENDGSTNIDGCTFTFNTAAGNGGAIENTQSLYVTRSTGGTPSTFTNNAATNGGAIDSTNNGQGNVNVNYSNLNGNTAASNGGAISTNIGVSLQDDTFGTSGANVATNGSGGAVYAVASADNQGVSVSVSYTTFQGNQANANGATGGAIYSSIDTTVAYSKLAGNQAQSDGGAIEALLVNTNYPGTPQNFTFSLEDVEFDGNTSTKGNGGAVNLLNSNNDGSSNVTVNDDTFYNNTAGGDGGGLYLSQSVSIPQPIYSPQGANPDTLGEVGVATSTATNDTFFTNLAKDEGGGFYMYLSNTTNNKNNLAFPLTSLTVYNNTAINDGGGGYITGSLPAGNTVGVDNSIFSGNFVTVNGFKGTVDLTVNPNALIKDLGYNMVGTTEGALFNAGTDVPPTNTPGLANALAQNGAAANIPMTLALSTTSAGYHKGDSPNLGGKPDERNFTRPMQNVSIGAEDPDAVAP